MGRDILRQFLVIVAVLATIIVNSLANIIEFNGYTTGEISDRFDVFFVPAGYVFSIWGVIYLGLIAYMVYQALPSQRENPRLRATGYLIVLSCIANIAWLLLWHYEYFELTLIAMFSLLLLLIATYLRLGIGKIDVPAGERWLVQLPFSIYLGWISVATIANVTSVLDYLNWDGFGVSGEVWTMLMLAAGVILTFLMALTRGDIAYGLVIVWAFIGIAVKHSDTQSVAIAAAIATGLTLAVLVIGVYLYRRSKGDDPEVKMVSSV